MEQELNRGLKAHSRDAELEFIFSSFCEQVAEIAAQHDIYVVATSRRGIENFNSLDVTQRLGIVETLKSYTEQLADASSKKIALVGDNRKAAWWTLRNLDMIPSENLFDKVEANDIVEIYDKDSVQMFRSFELFKHISYSLSEIFSFTWMDLFERDEFMFKRINDFVGKVLKGEIEDIFVPSVPNHIIKEKFSSGQRWIEIQQGVMAPLYDENKQVKGFFYTYKILNFGRNL